MKEVEKQFGGTISGRSKAYEDTSFVVGDSPVTLDINTDLGRNSRTGYIICDGAGDILVELSGDGTNYGTQFTMKDNEKVNLDGLSIDSIKITHSSDSSYRVNVA